MKYEMKHAKKEDKRKKVKIEKKAIIIALSIMVGIAIIVLAGLNFRMIYGFINSKIGILTSRLSNETDEKNEVVADEAENIEIEDTNTEDNMVEDLPEEELPEATDNKDDSQEEDKEDASRSIPTIKLEVYEGPLYSKADDVCYYRIKASVTGEPYPEIKFSKDDSLGSLGPDKAQVNLKRDSKTYILTATASNSEGKVSDTVTLIWNCNRAPDIKGISLSSDTLYVGKQYEASVEAIDLDGDELSYAWSVTGGSIVDNTTNPVKWNTPNTAGDYKISVAVSDGKGNTSQASILVYVGEVTVVEQSSTTSTVVPRKEDEGGYVEFGGTTYNSGNVYAGDSENNKPCMGFISFDISGLSGSIVESASLTFSGAIVSGDPLFLTYRILYINVLDWGARPITQNDFMLDGILVASYNSPNITCNVSKLKEELQKAINEGKSRFQIRIHFSGPYTDNDNKDDGWKYSQSNVNLNVTITR